MADGVTSLRPSADVSVGFVLEPAESTAGYLLINEESPDGSTTCLQHTFNSEDTSSFSESSTFKFACVDAQLLSCRIKSAKLYVAYGMAQLGSQVATLTNFRVDAMIAVDGVVSKTYSVTGTDGNGFIDLQYASYFADITDVLVNKSLSSDYTVTLTLICDNCETYRTEDTQVKTYTTNTKSITTAWIEVEYTTDIGVHHKANGAWVAATAAYRKVNGAWSEITEDECKAILSSNLIKKS